MAKTEVIAKAYRNRPLWMLCVSAERKRYYLLNPSLKNSPDPCKRQGLGYPKSHVFRANKGLFDSLQEAFAQQDWARLEVLWARAEPLAVN